MSLRNLLAVVLLPAAFACGKSESSVPDTTAVVSNVGRQQPDVVNAMTTPMVFNLYSDVFPPKTAIPARYTCEGENISPPLKWTGAPAKTKTFALIVEDPDAPDPGKPTRTVTHWVVYNIPASTTMLAETASTKKMPVGSAQGSNERGAQAYMGTCPPIGRHRYFLKLYALDTTLTGLKNPKKADLQKAMEGHVVGSAEMIGLYQKAKK